MWIKFSLLSVLKRRQLYFLKEIKQNLTYEQEDNKLPMIEKNPEIDLHYASTYDELINPGRVDNVFLRSFLTSGRENPDLWRSR